MQRKSFSTCVPEPLCRTNSSIKRISCGTKNTKVKTASPRNAWRKTSRTIYRSRMRMTRTVSVTRSRLRTGYRDGTRLKSASVGTRRDLAIQVHGKTLVKNDCRIARADLHFALRQCGKVGKLRSEEVLESSHGAIVDLHFSKPCACLFQIITQLAPDMHQFSQLTSASPPFFTSTPL